MMRRALVRSFAFWLEVALLAAVLHAHPAASGIAGFASPYDEDDCPVCVTLHSGQAPPVTPAALAAPLSFRQSDSPLPVRFPTETAPREISARGPPPPQTV